MNESLLTSILDSLKDARDILGQATNLQDVKAAFFCLEPFVLWPLPEQIALAAQGTSLSVLAPIGCNVLKDIETVVSGAVELENLLDGNDLDDETFEDVISEMQSLLIELCGLFPEVAVPLAEQQEIETDPEYWS